MNFWFKNLKVGRTPGFSQLVPLIQERLTSQKLKMKKQRFRNLNNNLRLQFLRIKD
jgi:hypothetical protein